MKLAYQAYDSDGRATRGVVEAANAQEATETLRARGLFATEVRDASPSSVAGQHRSNRSARSVGAARRLRLVGGMASQMSVLLSTGTTVVDAMTSLERQTTDQAWKRVLVSMRTHIEQGETLARAAASHPEYFDQIACSLITAGESGGKLDAMMNRLSKLYRQQVKVRNAVSGAMVYPVLLLMVAAGVLSTMLLFVLPRFEGLFQTLDVPLPTMTAILMWVSKQLTTWWWAIGLGVGGLVVSTLAYVRTPTGRRSMDGLMTSAPIVGGVYRAIVTARIARVLGVLLEGKVPLLDALRIVRDVSGNSRYEALLEQAEQKVLRGESMSQVLAGNHLIAPSVAEAVRSGERTAQLAPVLLTVAESMDEDNEVVVRTLTSVLEPLILIVLGAVVGLVAVSMFLPLFDLTAGINPGGANAGAPHPPHVAPDAATTANAGDHGGAP